MIPEERLQRLVKSRIDHTRVADQGARRYYFSDDALMRVTLVDHPGFDERRRTEHDREVEFLQSPPPGFDAPKLIAHGQEPGLLWLVRGIHQGPLLSQLIKAGAAFDADRIVAEILQQLVALERAGLYHDDLRGHNVIIDRDGHVRLIDYGSISAQASDCLYPHDLFLCFLNFVHEITGRIDLDRLPHTTTGRTVLLNLAALPIHDRQAFEQFLTLPVADRSFSRLQSIYQTINQPDSGPFVSWPEGIHLLVDKLHGAIAAHQDDIHRANAEIERLASQSERLTLQSERLQADQASAEARAAADRDANAALKGELATAKGRLVEIESRAATAEAAHDALQIRANADAERLRDLEARLEVSEALARRPLATIFASRVRERMQSVARRMRRHTARIVRRLTLR